MIQIPRLLLAGLSGGSGKTIVTLGLCRYFRQHGYSIQPFKKGPDYIDAAWLALAAGRDSSNLDPFLMPSEQLAALFTNRAAGCDLAVIEGNRGLFDGKDVEGSCSSAELSRLLKTPVVLIVDCTKMTRTVAALVQGCTSFDENVSLAGVVLNRTAGHRHRALLTRSVEQYTDVPVLGSLPKVPENPIPERHMGLISNQEFEADRALSLLSGVIGDWLDTDRFLDIAAQAPPLREGLELNWPNPTGGRRVRIGVVRDAALWFYYQENIEALRRAGAEIVELSLLQRSSWPEIHGLYLGGGFPESLATELAENATVRSRIQGMAAKGLPIYAECGGLMYLGESILCHGTEYPMAGVLPFKTQLCARPQGLGYTQARVCRPNPYHPLGACFPGHEFHYSKFLPLGPHMTFGLEMLRGKGICNGFDGIVSGNIFATYTHIHALGVPTWAQGFVDTARVYARHDQDGSIGHVGSRAAF